MINLSILFPYSVDVVLNYFTTTFGLDLTALSSYESLMIMILANLYFFVYWGFIIYIALKLFNRIYERIL